MSGKSKTAENQQSEGKDFLVQSDPSQLNEYLGRETVPDGDVIDMRIVFVHNLMFFIHYIQP